MTKYVPSKRGSYSASCGPCGGLIMFDWQNWQHKPKSSHSGFLLKKVPEWSDPEVSGSHDKSWSNSPNAEESHFSPAAIKHPRRNWQNRWDSGKITMDKLILNGLWGEWRSPVHCGSQGGWRGRGGYGDFSNKGEVIPSCVIPNHHTAFPFKSLTMGCFLYACLKLLTTADYEL